MSALDSKLFSVLQTHWGFNEFRPLQREAIEAVLTGRDSVVVLPTGAGKSLCYQLPAVLMPGLAVVVSPLISLMKDQVDALTENGIPAAAVHSALSPEERQRIAQEIKADRIKLLYVAPERLVTERMLAFLRERKLSFIAIDEAHCISNWGHDFRPEYRMLGELRSHFPGIGVHGFTATATEQVRGDIAVQLKLRQPEFLVGNFDRPNLQYRVLRRAGSGQQIQAVLQRHAGESGIIYCISRKEVDALTLALRSAGVKVAAYHAGLSDEERHRNQDAFLSEQVDVVVATVAFGMGIDKSNVRFVIHTGAPKSLEHYQQETGRAGRDGLDAECCLLHGGNDFMIWRKLSSELTGDAWQQMEANLRLMENYCTSVTCRHRALAEHFGQTYEPDNCQACDVCLDQQECLPESLIVAQKILSCVFRVNENFGADYVAQVLMGSREQRILDNGHEQLSTHGLLKEERKGTVREWIEQLCGQDFLFRDGEYRILKVTPSGREVLRGQQTPRLLKPAAGKTTVTSPSRKHFTVGMDAGLFEALRLLRRKLAEERGVPPFVVFGDVTLQDLARRRPTTLPGFRQVHGVGEHKAQQYGEMFTTEIARYCAANQVPVDVPIANDPTSPAAAEGLSSLSKSAAKMAADALFREGRSIEEVATQLGRANSTVTGYLFEFLIQEGHLSPEPWLDEASFTAISAAAKTAGLERLKPIFDQLEGKYSYDQIRIAVACLKNRDG
ncbi:MAG: DNA helicase RecQ [Planctomycetales bacterium]|nr:DNA helicase RecQ [Planctomycetales bacterium]